MKIGIAADHAGLNHFKILTNELSANGFRIIDLMGDNLYDDYPDAATLIAKALSQKTIERGILICGSGVGVSVAINKYPGIRAAVCHDCYSAHQGVEHDKMNVLCLGERVIGSALALDIAVAFLNASFSGEERHVRRLEKITMIERENMKPTPYNNVE